MTGTVYLLHFDRPYKHARHYTGWAADLDARLDQHRHGHGARLLAVLKDAGIGWQLARTWPGDRRRERQIKNMGGASRSCPFCGVTPRPAREGQPATHATDTTPQPTRDNDAAGGRQAATPGGLETRAHGTRACYVWGPGPGPGPGCRCAACTTANRADAVRRARLRAYGRWQPFTDADPVRQHLEALSRAGIGWKRAAELAGTSSSVVSRLLFGGPGDRPPPQRVRPDTATAILAVPITAASLGGGSLVPAAGTRRRLQALVAIGWSQSQLASRLGVLPSNFSAVLARERVTAATARAVKSLYDQLWDRPPAEADHRSRIAAARARRRAQARGWPPPAAWDDQAIDNPAAAPAPGWQRTRMSSAELADEARDLLVQGLTRDHAAQRLGRTRYAIDKALSRYPDASGARASQAGEGAA